MIYFRLLIKADIKGTFQVQLFLRKSAKCTKLISVENVIILYRIDFTWTVP